MDPETQRIIKYYNELPSRIIKVRKVLGRPLTLSEKILYSHLYRLEETTSFLRGIDYAEFSPARVAMQDATAQMAILQFMLAGKESSSVPASVHCDHLVVAKSGREKDVERGGNIGRVL